MTYDRPLTQPSSASPSGLWQFDGFVLDQNLGRLQSGGVDVHLRPKALALLEYFLSNPGRVLDKDSLTDAIWPTVTVSDDSIAQCVSELRRRLGPSAARIRTVPRRGYIFMSDGIDTGRPPIPAASAAEAAQPSILVLPFVTFDPDDRIVDGLAEQISAGLGRFKQVFVIAHDSARALRRTGIDDFGPPGR